MDKRMQLLEKLHELDITRVAVFDDEVDAANVLWVTNNEVWEGLFAPTSHGGLLEQGLGLSRVEELRTLAPDERAAALDEIQAYVPIDEIAAAEAQSKGILAQWIAALRGWGLEVDTYTGWAAFSR